MSRFSHSVTACLFCLALVPTLASAQEPAPFAFRSSFWLNLHHFLFEEAVLEVRGKGRGTAAGWEPAEREAWGKAVAFYRESLLERSLLFDEGMVTSKDALADLGEAAAPAGAGLEPAWAAVLAAAAPIYRHRLWPEHDAANRRLIARLEPLVRDHARLTGELSRLFRTPWPTEPMRVDVSAWAGSVGAYTTLRPTRLTVAADDARQEGNAALEVVFHEASHALVRPIHLALDAELAKQGRKLPNPDLWHAVLFYTTGEAMRRELPGYTPYPEAQGLWERAWPMYIAALREHWQPYLDGKASLEEAVSKLIAAVGQAATPAEAS